VKVRERSAKSWTKGPQKRSDMMTRLQIIKVRSCSRVGAFILFLSYVCLMVIITSLDMEKRKKKLPL
jgi:hypothetical protein